jgi:hypothetical protein
VRFSGLHSQLSSLNKIRPCSPSIRWAKILESEACSANDLFSSANDDAL